MQSDAMRKKGIIHKTAVFMDNIYLLCINNLINNKDVINNSMCMSSKEISSGTFSSAQTKLIRRTENPVS